jgi:hypothetical protein
MSTLFWNAIVPLGISFGFFWLADAVRNRFKNFYLALCFSFIGIAGLMHILTFLMLKINS